MEEERNVSLNKTTLVIAHRLSTILQADQILVLEDGHVTGVGIHEKPIHITKKLYNSNLR